MANTREKKTIIKETKSKSHGVLGNVTQKKAVKKELRNKEDIKHTENKEQNGKSKSVFISSYFKCKWLNSPIKRQRLAEWIINKHDPTTRCLKETHFRTKESESEWMENILNANSNQKRDVYTNKRNHEL